MASKTLITAAVLLLCVWAGGDLYTVAGLSQSPWEEGGPERRLYRIPGQTS